MSVHTTWHGKELEDRVGRAIGRAVISIGEQIAAEAKQIVHVDTGTLRRSIHVAKVDEIHFLDDDEAKVEDLQEDRVPLEPFEVVDDLQAIIEVGSWIAYACVEETGRHHYYMHPAYELVAPTGWLTIETAFGEEGLI